MSDILGWLNPMRWIALAVILAALTAGYFGWRTHERNIGRDEGKAEVQAKWDADTVKRQAAAIKEAAANAQETQRRLAAQQANQEKQNAELALARAAADRNRLDAERVRKQSSAAADLWSHTLRHSPTSADLAAADTAIHVYADLFGRADRRAGELAAYSDAARAAGLKCERDYSALTVKP